MTAGFPKSLTRKLNAREAGQALRRLPEANDLVDFSSNDYLGFAQSQSLFKAAHQFLIDNNVVQNGATGSRLISGNFPLYEQIENQIASFHSAENALMFNSGYDANVGLFSSVPERSDVILFDELSHASIRDGIRLSAAKSYKFSHNDIDGLARLLEKFRDSTQEIYVATESVFSMDGDSPNLEQMIALCEKYNAHLIVDEAHALGVFGDKGEGLTQPYANRIFARVMTFGKGLGCHGAVILGSADLRNYLVNFARSFIYTTALPPHSVATISAAYHRLGEDQKSLFGLRENINFFNREKLGRGLKPLFVYSKSAIQSAVIPGNEKVRSIAARLQQGGFDVKAILSPTVPEGQERLRICLHSYNSQHEITNLLALLSNSL